MEHLLIGTRNGFVQAWCMANLGIENRKAMEEQIMTTGIQSICWFHYSGQAQSRRFLILS